MRASTSSKSEPAPTVMVASPILKLDKKAQVFIMGAGFEPGQEVHPLFTTMDGVRADIGYALDSEPVASAIDAWSTAWRGCGRYIKKKLMK